MSDLYERFLVKLDEKPAGERSSVAKDRDRLIHSSALRRLQGKSQIVGVEVTDFFRTRLTHSLECAQIGRAIAKRVAATDDWASVVKDPADLPDLVEAACLAHDLGHPPFGHNGEVALRAKMQEYNGSLFEGNAQSFRVVTFLEAKRYGETRLGADQVRWVGLDLTRTTLRALLKYPVPETKGMLKEEHPKFGVYDDPLDREYFDWVWDGAPAKRTLATEIMDTADDIAYAAHDFEDGVWAGMIPLYELLTDNSRIVQLLEAKVLDRDRAGLFAHGEFRRTLDELLKPEKLDYLRRGPYDGTRYGRAALKDYTASQIHYFVHAATPEGRFLEPGGDVLRRLNVLKAMAWEWMIQRTDITTLQFGQRRLVCDLFDGYWKKPEMLPRQDEWRLISNDKPAGIRRRLPRKARFICDHIAGMTDGYAREVHARMVGGAQHRDVRHSY